MYRHDWLATQAAALFAAASQHDGRRYATANGIAFEAKSAADGTWHGYPIPWERIPAIVKDKWLAEKVVTRRQIKRFFSFNKDDIHWALETDRL